MSTPYVTIGGKEVSLTPGGVLRQNGPASGKAVAAPPVSRPKNGRLGRRAALIGLIAALSALVVLGVWLGAYRKK